ncbi:MAG: hypothetical protein DHS20C17_08870 [Cyclobacteriaceae bacterium]|nr:MAG: hypothetical protein DHS20C17_08870 [Cyclobacteriaceae bacterium]
MTKGIEREIRNYLDGSMSPNEKLSFEEKLSGDEQLAQEVADLKALEDGLHATGAKMLSSEMKQWEAGLNTENHGWMQYFAAAAVVALILMPVIYFVTAQRPTSEELFLANYQPYEEMITQRGASDDSLHVYLIDGLEAYNSGAYKKCSELLGSYLKMYPDEHRVALYLAIAQLEINQKSLAASNFQRAQQDPVVRQQAQWYQALAYLKFSETTSAIEILKTISNTKGHYRQQEAKRLLKDLS